MARIAKAKPCPFCRSTDSFIECADFGSFYRVCNVCLARGPRLPVEKRPKRPPMFPMKEQPQ